MPTRAEVNILISTLIKGAGILMLATETRVGEYSIESFIILNKLKDQFQR